MPAKHMSPPDFDPRHRIAGAIVLALLVVIFVPMILGEPERVVEHAAREKTQPAEGITDDGLKRYVTRLPGPEAEREDSAMAARPSSGSDASGNTSWEVWVAAFSQQDYVDKLIGKLEDLGYDAHSRELGKGYIRVWLGPYTDEKIARTVNEKVSSKFKVKGIVAKH